MKTILSPMQGTKPLHPTHLRLGPLLLLLLVGWLAAPAAMADDPPNILFIMIDDFGTDRFQRTTAYDEQSEFYPPDTPALDDLASSGVLFRNAYGSPVCSPARALLMAGRYGFRTGIGKIIPPEDDDTGGLFLNEVILPEVLTGLGYATGYFGKWHLGKACDLGTGNSDDHGFDRFIGTRGNVGQHGPPALHYCNWPRIDNSPSFSIPCGTLDTTHATEETTAEAKSWIAAREQEEEQWFCVVSYMAIHTPLQWPSGSNQCEPADDLEHLDVLNAMLAHTDSNIADLLTAIDPDTTMVFVMSDNGTQGDDETVSTPYELGHFKGTVYEQGVRIPLIVSGPAVVDPGRTSDELVSLVDVFRTVTDLAGLSSPGSGVATDSQSFLDVLESNTANGPRTTVFCESFDPNHGTITSYNRSIRNDSYKLIKKKAAGGAVTTEFYEMTADHLEDVELISHYGGTLPSGVIRDNYLSLLNALNALLSS